jgi:serine phosphatase RsbU (regulator of sigma subunit)
MLGLNDFFHLPEVDNLLVELAAQKTGLSLVAGLEAHPAAGGGGFIPSGRATIFRILARQLLSEGAGGKAALVAEQRDALRLPRQMRRQVAWIKVGPLTNQQEALAEAIRLRPSLILLDRLDEETAVSALTAANDGLRILAQIDTVYQGAAVARYLLTLGAPPELLAGLTWIISVQRLSALCSHCKQPAPVEMGELTSLRSRYPALALDGPFYRTAGCPNCQGAGRYGEVALFDIFHADASPPELFHRPSRLSREEYLLRLAELGYLPLEEIYQATSDQLHQAYTLLTASERALTQANTALSQSNNRLQQKLVEIEAANRVLEQRTEALISFQDMSMRLIASASLPEIAERVCRNSCSLGGACQAILYYFHGDETAEILAAHGWDKIAPPKRVDAPPNRVDAPPNLVDAHLLLPVWSASADAQPLPFNGHPPGISPTAECKTAGLQFPLIAQDEQGQNQILVGSIIVYPKIAAGFAPGELALLTAFANQAALALQRSDLIAALQDKIEALQAAQTQIIHKERLEKELDLAREVQQSLLPTAFPLIPGYRFAVRSQPARVVGGDFYDVFQLDERRFGLAIADVSDKGMPAALFMGLTRSLLLAEARRGESPRAVLRSVNRLLMELGESNMFVTVFYAIVDTATGLLTYARAGHDWPLLLRNGRTRRLKGQGMFLGFWDESLFELSEETLQLQANDQLLLYTDGLTDAMAMDGRCFSLLQLEKLVETLAHLKAEQLCRATLAELAHFQGEAEQFDDMTLLVMTVN